MKDYQPYKTDAFLELMRMAYNLGWYGGERMLFSIQMKGAFEGWSGRATEDWEQRFYIISEPITNGEGKLIWKGISVQGETLEEASLKAINSMK